MIKPEDIVQQMFSKDAFSRWLGIQVLETGKGRCRLSMTIRKEMLNGFYIAHGGITYALADSALAFASNSHGRQAVSIDTAINHIEPLKEGDEITAIAREDALKNKFAFYTVEVLKGDTRVALFKGTVYRTDREWGE